MPVDQCCALQRARRKLKQALKHRSDLHYSSLRGFARGTLRCVIDQLLFNLIGEYNTTLPTDLDTEDTPPLFLPHRVVAGLVAAGLAQLKTGALNHPFPEYYLLVTEPVDLFAPPTDDDSEEEDSFLNDNEFTAGYQLGSLVWSQENNMADSAMNVFDALLSA
jgi:hypothetical protein